jgi:hypothetical protein
VKRQYALHPELLVERELRLLPGSLRFSYLLAAVPQRGA